MTGFALTAGGMLAVPLAALFLLRARLAVIRVRGTSMLPALQPGDRVLVRHGRPDSPGRRLGVGMIVVVRSPEAGPAPRGTWPVAPRLGFDRWVIKRVAALPGDAVPDEMSRAAGGAVIVPDRRLLLAADNPDGTDSRQWGFIDASDVLGPVVRKLKSPPRGR